MIYDDLTSLVLSKVPRVSLIAIPLVSGGKTFSTKGLEHVKVKHNVPSYFPSGAREGWANRERWKYQKY